MIIGKDAIREGLNRLLYGGPLSAKSAVTGYLWSINRVITNTTSLLPNLLDILFQFVVES